MGKSILVGALGYGRRKKADKKDAVKSDEPQRWKITLGERACQTIRLWSRQWENPRKRLRKPPDRGRISVLFVLAFFHRRIQLDAALCISSLRSG